MRNMYVHLCQKDDFFLIFSSISVNPYKVLQIMHLFSPQNNLPVLKAGCGIIISCLLCYFRCLAHIIVLAHMITNPPRMWFILSMCFHVSSGTLSWYYITTTAVNATHQRFLHTRCNSWHLCGFMYHMCCRIVVRSPYEWYMCTQCCMCCMSSQAPMGLQASIIWGYSKMMKILHFK